MEHNLLDYPDPLVLNPLGLDLPCTTYAGTDDPWFREAATSKAKRLCAPCPVKEKCLEIGMTELHGVWGGKSVTERAAMVGVARQSGRHLRYSKPAVIEFDLNYARRLIAQLGNKKAAAATMGMNEWTLRRRLRADDLLRAGA